ncbi:WecB/TagA/CpsF family glycosyltransferase [Kocuria rhizosphaericola]|uniref:WecB/TagA/CpsF family glycosyltransferase n=1 Tax=Kocuria rhizosphaericola TaxID=3376284 RepID=UPI0037B640BD
MKSSRIHPVASRLTGHGHQPRTKGGNRISPGADSEWPSRATVAGIAVTATTRDDAVQRILNAARTPEPASFHFINAWTISLASNDPALKALLNDSTAVFPDGKPLTMAARLRTPAAHQIRGPAAFEDCFFHGQRLGVRHFLLGSTPETLDRLVARLLDRYPATQIAGVYSPPYRPLEASEQKFQDSLIKASGANIVWVGLGTPKQDFEATRIAASTGLTTAAVGAAFDFSAGAKRQAPHWMTTVGLEWLFRLLSEPRRLWKRYLLGNPSFVAAVVKHWRDQ